MEQKYYITTRRFFDKYSRELNPNIIVTPDMLSSVSNSLKVGQIREVTEDDLKKHREAIAKVEKAAKDKAEATKKRVDAAQVAVNAKESPEYKELEGKYNALVKVAEDTPLVTESPEYKELENKYKALVEKLDKTSDNQNTKNSKA